MSKLLCRLACTVLLPVAMQGALAADAGEATCGPLKLAFGPFDYRADRHKWVSGIEAADGDQHRSILNMVEGAHFKPQTEALLYGKTRESTPGGDIGYTLHAIPNNHRALIAVMRYGKKLKTDRPPDMLYSVECYFDRAVRFAPDDAIVRMIFAQYLASKSRQPEAVRQLEVAEGLAAENGFTHYNVGMVYLEIGEPDRALKQAYRAAALGFQRTELEQSLRKAGKWQDPPAAAASAPAAGGKS